MLHENFVYLGAALGAVGTITYLVATLRGLTKPNRVTWFLWGVAPLLAFRGALDEGVGVQALMTFTVGFGPLCIFLASFVNRQAYWRITRLDIICGALSVCGLVLWAVTRDGNLAIAAGITADGLAGIPTVVKAFRYPSTEKSWVFWLAGLNALITLLTIDRWDFAHYGFPLYILVICLILGSLITFRIGERLLAASGRQAHT